MYGDKGSTQIVGVVQWTVDLPHVDQILGQSHGLAVPADGDGPVQVGGGVPVLAVGDPDHGAAYLPRMTSLSNLSTGSIVRLL